MSEGTSDAIVFFGATGDLAFKQIFPALYAMMRRGHLDVRLLSRDAGAQRFDSHHWEGLVATRRYD